MRLPDREDVENAPSWELRHILSGREVGIDLKERLCEYGARGCQEDHPLQAWITIKERKVRTSRKAPRENNKGGGYMPDGVSTGVNDRELSCVRTRKLKQG